MLYFVLTILLCYSCHKDDSVVQNFQNFIIVQLDKFGILISVIFHSLLFCIKGQDFDVDKSILNS